MRGEDEQDRNAIRLPLGVRLPRLSLMQRMRLQFIVVSAIALGIVLTLILGIAEMSVYTEMIDTADQMLVMMADNDGHFPDDPLAYETYGADITREAPYESRWFSVKVNALDGSIETDTAQTIRIDDEAARAYTDVASHSGSKFGFVSDFRFIRRHAESGDLYVFLDRGRQLSAFYKGLSSMIIIVVIGATMVLAILAVASQEILRPLVESQLKQRRFIADAGHDIKTPLTVISADAEVLSYEVGADNVWVEDIRRQVGILTGLTNDLIFLSRMEEDQRSMTKVELDLSALVTEQVNSFRTAAMAARRGITSDVGEGIMFVGDERMLRQLMSVLLDNAIKYSAEGTEIGVTLERKRKTISLEVINIATEGSLDHVDKWFDRFYQEDAARTHSQGGFGIGLSIAEAVTKASGGRIQASVWEGNLLVMSVLLPAA